MADEQRDTQGPIKMEGCPIQPAPGRVAGDTHIYQQFPDAIPDIARAFPPKVCIVTSEIVGPFKNGGIGTSMTGLAETLAAARFPVTVLYTGAIWNPDAAMNEWRRRYNRIGIDLVWLTLSDMARVTGPMKDCGFGVPFLVYEYLRDNRFDIIHFNDCMGEGFYCLAMKRMGAAFNDSLLAVALHSPSQWVYELNRLLPDSPLFAAFNYAERLSTRCADLLWCPSRYLLDWSRAKGFVHPAATYVQQYAIPTVTLFGGGPEQRAQQAITTGNPVRPTEIVFFGRIEERKGIRVFCNALQQLNDFLANRNITVTFLGKSGKVGGVEALSYIGSRAAGWRFAWKTINDLGQQEAIDYIRSRPAMAVMPSAVDNSPCTVYEALNFGIPFIASGTGGVPELIAAADRDAVLFEYSPNALARKLEQVVREGVRLARPSLSQAENRQRWINAHRAWRDLLPAEPPFLEPPRRLCAVIDHAPGLGLETTLASLPPEVHRVVIVDRSTTPVRATCVVARIRVIDLRTGDTGALLDEIGEDPTEAVLLLHSGVAVRREAVAGMLHALSRPEVDGLVPAALSGKGKERAVVPPLGGSPAFSFYQGLSITGGLVVKAERLSRVVRDGALAIESELFGLADLALSGGLELWPYVEPVLWYPPGYVTPSPGPGVPERIAAYDRASPTERYYIAAIGYAAVTRRGAPLALPREVALQLSKRRLGWAVTLGLRLVPRRVINAVFARLHRPVRWIINR
jgi:glycosyltransferase involved in cell wall biosynthesis